MLTETELHAMQMTGDLYNYVSKNVIADGKGRDNDLNEFAAMIHTIQRYIMAQSACRAHPGQFRLLGASDCGVKVRNARICIVDWYHNQDTFLAAVARCTKHILREHGDISTTEWSVTEGYDNCMMEVIYWT